jgi:hypothetical protein
MNRTQSALNSRRRLSLLLVLSIAAGVLAFASPLSFADRDATIDVAPPNPFDGPTDFIRQIPLTTNDLVYSAATGKLYASVPSSVGSGGNSIVTIDPATGAVGSSTFIGSEPNKLTLADDGQNLYVSLDGSFAIRRFDVTTNTPGLQFSVGQDSFFGRYIISDFAVAPGNSNLLAVARRFSGISPPQAGVVVFDNGVRRPNVGPGADFLAFSASASKLYGSGPFNGVQTMTVDASGVSGGPTGTTGFTGRITFANGLIFTSQGQVINPDTNTLLGTFSGVNTQAFVADTAVGRAYYLTNGPTSGTLTLKAFDINTFVLLGSLTINGVSGTPSSLLRWGPNGVAFRTSSNQLFIIQTSLIPSAEPIPTPTPTPSPTPSPSPSPTAPMFIKQVALSANDLIFSQATQKLYASVPSSEGSTGNSIAEIDPLMGSITNQTFVGSEPTQLGQADDGSTLYVGLDGAASIRSYNIVSHTAGQQFNVGRDTSNGPYSFSDIAVLPGNPSVIAVARQHRSVSPSEAGVAIFDNGVQRPQVGPGHTNGSDFLAFASSSTLYGNGSQGLTTMTVDNNGVTVASTAPFTTGNSLILANNLVYGSTGQVINPATGQLVGSFTGTFMSDAIHAVDTVNGRVFFLVLTGSSVQLRAYDINTFLLIGSINIPGVIGTPRNLVRWGTNGLAFRTTNRQIVLIETALVNPGIPVAAPTPTPSPTPSPTPPYIPTFVRRVNLPANNLVSSEATQALYASVPGSAGPTGNSITKITPATGEIGPSTFVGSEPNKMAISSDGQTVWVHLNGANAARRFDVMSQTAGLQFTTRSVPPTDIEVVPGSPQSVALSMGQSGGGVAIYDNGTQRPNTGNSFPSVGPIEFGASASVLYGYNSFSTSFDVVKFTVDGSGVTTANVMRNFLTDFVDQLKFSDGLLYSGSGRVVDPELGTMVGTLQTTHGASAMTVDAANHRVFYAFTSGSNSIIIKGFDSNTFLPVGTITIPGIANVPVNLVRWGTNGLAFNTVPPFGFTEPSRVYLVQTQLVSNAGTIPTGVQFDTATATAFEGNSLSVKVNRTGDVSATTSVNYATSDGTATAASDYTATSGTLTFSPGELSKNISIPILNDNLFENANETFNVTLSSPTGPAELLTPSTMAITINDANVKPSISITSTVLVNEGDSGTKNISVNVRLTNRTVQVVTANVSTVDLTATAGSDYVATSESVTIPAGSLFTSVNIVIIGDTIVEPNELFLVGLSNATNVSFVSNSTTQVGILDDDATVQLSSAALDVPEKAGFATVTATRVGDTSRAATVLYSTADTAGLQNCTLVNGKASERCDYATAFGRLEFAIGETTATIVIPVVDDVLVEGNETFTLTLSGPAGATLGTTNTATITIVDNDATPATQNPVDGVNFFVTQQYIDFLGRLPDSIGFANWTNTLGNCPNNGLGEFDNPDCDRVHVSSGFFLSEEFRVRGYWAYKFYEVGLDRRPTYAEFVPDMAQVGGPQSPQSEAISKAAYMDAFLQRQEFKNRFDALSNGAYVDALETNAEVTLANKAALVDALNTSQKTRAQVLREIVELQSVEDRFFIRAFVAMQYFGYLRRDPDTIGYNNWVTTLTADPGNFRHMIFGFIYSTEYRQRFGP